MRKLHYYSFCFQENDLKRARALKKTKTEQELGRQKDKEIDRLQQEIDELTEVVAKQKSDLTRYKIYQKFMERVLDKSDEVQICFCVRHEQLTPYYRTLLCENDIFIITISCSLMKLVKSLLAMIHSNIPERYTNLEVLHLQCAILHESDHSFFIDTCTSVRYIYI